MFHTSSIELYPEALESNLNFVRSIVGNETILSSVVKGNAYGHGIEQFVPMAFEAGVRHFSVHSADEAIRVFETVDNAHVTIMIMGFLSGESMHWAINHDIEFFVFDFERLQEALEVARSCEKKARVHIELETGMNRTGFNEASWERLAQYLQEHDAYLHLAGLCTHFAGAESISNWVRLQEQKKLFEAGLAFFENRGLYPDCRHACCSAAMIRFPDMHLDLVRVGIMQYGFWPSREIFIENIKQYDYREDPLRRVISWTSRIMSTKEVPIGEYIGYGTTFLAQKDMKIAIIPVGYSHGFSRSLSNQGRVIVRGHRTSVVGLVNMNNLIIDITDVPDAEVGDLVTLIGKDGSTEVTVSSFGELSDQLNYELLTRLPYHIPRTINKTHGLHRTV